jgi:flagellar biogenesis protein FliO
MGRMGKAFSGKHIKIVDRIALGAGSAACVIKVGERYFLVGVSEKSVRLLSELEGFSPHELDEPAGFADKAAFGKLLNGFLRKGKDSKDDVGP